VPDPARNTPLELTLTMSILLATVLGTVALVYPAAPPNEELANRIPEAAPYVTSEAAFVAPPFEEYWTTTDHPAQCQTCHKKIFDEWKGSMMANAWRDPAWRAAFLLSARQISTHGNCDTPAPPDGTARAHHNPFAGIDECVSKFDLGNGRQTMSHSGSLVDGACSRCHMPTNYVDNVPLQNVTVDAQSGLEHGAVDNDFNPTSDNGTGLAFATLDAQLRNTDSGKAGVVCMVCHSLAETRNTPYHNQAKSLTKNGYTPALGTQSRAELLGAPDRDITEVPDQSNSNLGYGVGGGAYRLSPHAIAFPERLGPLSSALRAAEPDGYLSSVFKRPALSQPMVSPKHDGYRQVMATRAEFCSTCHDVTNLMTIKNALGKWVGGFPIERTYAEWAGSRYADRPGNANFNPAFKRDCQTCHMQQDYGQPGTAHTLYKDGAPIAPLTGPVVTDGPSRTYFSHHFIGGNAYIPRLVGANLDDNGSVEPYPELSTFSFSSADEKSVYHNAYWMNADKRGAATQQARLAWERLRNVLDLTLAGPASAAAGGPVPIRISVANTGSGHNFPTGFPEGRIAWVAVSAIDLATGRELPIHDAVWNRTSIGVGRFTTTDMMDPAFPECGWKIPAGSPDPYSYQFKAVATRGDECPTLELVYAAPRNLVTNAKGLPIDARGVVIDKQNPLGEPIFRDLNGNGDVFDDAFLRDTRLRPMPHAGATVTLDRYAVVIPPGTRGPIAVTAAVYYQSLEAIVAKKFLGNLADTNTNSVLEPCVLGGRCDGRRPSVEPAVVEGAPPVPMEVRNWVIRVDGERTTMTEPTVVATYPRPGATDAFMDVVPKASFSEPVTGLDSNAFTLVDRAGTAVPASVHQIGEGTWGLFADQIFLKAGETYTVRVAAGVCGYAKTCTRKAIAWTFTVAAKRGDGAGDTTIPAGFPAPGVVHKGDRNR
jgi:Bacterial Ig-like domain/Cytochrome c554 and c-prime